jgi:hypothetical protein
MLIKICGLTRPADAEDAIESGADLLGFVFVPGTPRAVSPAEAAWIRDIVGAEKVGVFRDAELDEIITIRDDLGLDRVQLHGAEPDEWLEDLGPETLRRVRPDGADPWRRAAALSARRPCAGSDPTGPIPGGGRRRSRVVACRCSTRAPAMGWRSSGVFSGHVPQVCGSASPAD